jgi:phage-related protein
MKTSLLDIADKFAHMPAGADKTAFAVKLFGKSGLAMLPFLNKGKKGVEELMKSSDKLGTTLSDKDVKAAKANVMAKRELHHAIEGLQISVGRELYPIMTTFAKMLTDKVVPAVKSVLDWMKEHKKIVVILAGVVGGLIIAHKLMATATTLWKDAQLIWTGVQKAATVAQWLFNAALDANPIGLVVLAIAAFIGALVLLYQHNSAFRALVQKVWGAIKGAVSGFVEWFTSTALPWITNAIGVVAKVVGGLWSTFSGAFGHIKDAVGTAVGWIQDKFNGLLDFFSGLGSSIAGIFSGVWSGIVTTFKSVWNHLADLWNGGANIANHIPGVSLPQIPHLAKGGIVNRPTIALIGEAGPEAVVPLSKGGGLGGGNVYVNITVNGDTDPVNAARRIGAILDKGIASGAWRPIRLATR